MFIVRNGTGINSQAVKKRKKNPYLIKEQAMQFPFSCPTNFLVLFNALCRGERQSHPNHFDTLK